MGHRWFTKVKWAVLFVKCGTTDENIRSIMVENIFVNDNTTAYIYVVVNASGEMETPKAHRVSTSVYTQK